MELDIAEFRKMEAELHIVDSLWETQSQFCFSQEWVCLLKAALYEVVCKNKEEF